MKKDLPVWREDMCPGLNLRLSPPLFPDPVSNMIFLALEQEVQYLTNQKVHLFGQQFNIKRQHVGYGSHPALKYSYGGLMLHAKPWTPVMLALRDRINELTGEEYNFAVVNRLKDGKDCLGFLQDDDCTETDIQSGTTYLTFGANRDWTMRNKGYVSDQSLTLNLLNGTMLRAIPPTTECYYIGIPQRPSVIEPCISIAFKRICQDGRKKMKKNGNPCSCRSYCAC